LKEVVLAVHKFCNLGIKGHRDGALLALILTYSHFVILAAPLFVCCRLWSKQAHHPSEDAVAAGSSSTTPHGSVVSLQALDSQSSQRQQQQQPNGSTHGGNHGHGH
jgi:hypothetical protein